MSLVEEETQVLISLAVGLPKFINQRRVVHVVLESKDHSCVPVRSETFRVWAAGAYFRLEKKGVSSPRAMKTTMETIEGIAREANVTRRLEPRFNRDETGTVWIDLRDDVGRAVKVTADGWSIVDSPPALFRRFAHMLPMPVPVAGGNLDLLRKYVNVASDDDFMLLKVALVLMPLLDVPRPLLMLHGGAGSAKTTAGNFLRRLIDPSVAKGLALPANERELALALDQHAFPVFDNTSGFRKGMSDALCRAVTGGSFTARKLFTDQDTVLLEYIRPIAITGINVPTDATDLIDRMMMLELTRLAPETRKTMAALSQSFDAEHPAMLGALLDALCIVLRDKDTGDNSNLGRLADFHRLGRVAARALGYKPQKFDDVYKAKTLAQSWTTADDDVVARLVVDLVQKNLAGTFTGSMSALLEKLGTENPKLKAALPKTPAALGRRLRELEPLFQQMNISTEFTATNAAGRTVTLKQNVAAVPPVMPPRGAGDQPATPAGSGGIAA